MSHVIPFVCGAAVGALALYYHRYRLNKLVRLDHLANYSMLNASAEYVTTKGIRKVTDYSLIDVIKRDGFDIDALVSYTEVFGGVAGLVVNACDYLKYTPQAVMGSNNIFVVKTCIPNKRQNHRQNQRER